MYSIRRSSLKTERRSLRMCKLSICTVLRTEKLMGALSLPVLSIPQLIL